MTPSNILIIGNGYLGSYLVDQLSEHDEVGQVAVASKNGTGTCLEADLGDPTSIESLACALAFEPDIVIHCASSSRGGPDAYRQVFLFGARHLNQAFPSATKILTSSTSVYPQVDGSVVTEMTDANPERQTGQWLRQAEAEILSGKGIVLRLAGIYGPGRSVYLRRMREGTAKIESGEVSRWLNQIHRDDAAGAILHLIRQGEAISQFQSEIYNVCDDVPISQRDCYQGLAKILNLPVPGEAPPDLNRKRAWTHKRVDNRKLKATGWQLQFPSFLQAVEEDTRL